jgi:hypothetical protein
MDFWEGLGFRPRVVQLTSPTSTVLRRLEDDERLDGAS